MTLFFALLPLYIFGNIHCLGMCGPLVMLLGQHKHRYFYFIGRIISFSLAAMLAGEAGAVLHVVLNQYHIAEATSFFFGGIIFALGLQYLCQWRLPRWTFFSRLWAPINHSLSCLMLRDTPWSTFLFGFFTVLLPCGQTLIVFSACALTGSAYIGLLNGFALALFTTPSLALAMHSHVLVKRFKNHYNTVIGVCSLMIGTLAICRGFAEMGMIPHLILNPDAPSYTHIVIF